MSRYTSLELSKKLRDVFPEWKSDKVWMQSYSMSEMGEAHDDYELTPPEARNQVHVYEWRVTDNPRNRITTGQEVFKWWYSKVRELEYAAVPAYDTDYLLEKLPANIVSQAYSNFDAQLWVRKEQEDDEPIKYFAYYAVMSKQDCVSDFGVHADTPAEVLGLLALELKKKEVI